MAGDSWYWNQTGAIAVSPTTSNAWTKEDGTLGNPAAGDFVYVIPIPGLSLAPIGFGDTSAVIYASLTTSAALPQACTIGTQDTSSADLFGYWKLKANIVNLGVPASGGGNIVQNSSGPGRIKLNLSTNATVLNIFSTGVSIDSGLEPDRVICVNSANIFNVQGGVVGIATNLPGEVSTIGSASAVNTGTELDFGAVTATTVSIAGGANGFLENSPATLNVAASSTCTILGTSEITTLNNYGTTFANNRPGSGAAIGTLNGYGGSITNFAGNPEACTVTTFNVYSSSLQDVVIQQFQTNPAQVTFTTINPFGAGVVTWN